MNLRTLAICLGASVLSTLVSLGGKADGLAVDPACAAYVPYGIPTMADQHPSTLACRVGYLSQVNGKTLQPDWVAWKLTPARAMGCTARTNPFHADGKLPTGFYAAPGDYSKTGYDLGHLSPYDDNAVSPEMGHESFDVPTNFSPQLPKLNRWEWEQLEVDTRAWTQTVGDLIVIDGPIYSGAPATIGQHHIAVPNAFFKVVIGAGKAVGFTMTNAAHPKGPVEPYVVAISDIEREAGITIPLPSGMDKAHVTLPWPADTAGFAKAKKAACKGN